MSKLVISQQSPFIDDVCIKHYWACPFVDEDDNPIDELNMECERKVLEKVIFDSGLSIRFRSAVATKEELELQDCTIAHFSMHGSEVRGLGFEYSLEDFNSFNIGAVDYFTEIDKSLEFNPKLVFLSACHSESVADIFLSIGVRHIIAVNR